MILDSLPAEGESLRCRLLVRSPKILKSRRGSFYLHVQALFPNGTFAARVWDSAQDLFDFFKQPQVIEVDLLATSYGFELHNIDPCPQEPEDPWNFLPRGPLDETKAWSELCAHLKELVTAADLRALLDDLLADEDFCYRYRRAPAALEVHHPYRGGLVEHVSSCLCSARDLAIHYGAEVSMVAMGLWLHDVGKLWEIDALKGSYTREGELLGHLVMGTSWLQSRIAQIEDFSADRSAQLLHCLVAHHGSLEKGSPRPPMSLAAVLVHTLDRLDSEMFQITRSFQEAQEDDFSSHNPWLKRKFYRSKSLSTHV